MIEEEASSLAVVGSSACRSLFLAWSFQRIIKSSLSGGQRTHTHTQLAWLLLPPFLHPASAKKVLSQLMN